MGKAGNKADADYPEELVGIALESFLTAICFPERHFSIEPFSRAKERWLGADARLHRHIAGFRPFYMQFKKPSAYPDHSGAGIIKDRKKLKLPASPRALYFPLRRKADGHADFQHNVLFRLRRRLRARNLGDAAYVCPLFLERSVYRFHLHGAALNSWWRVARRYPWSWDGVMLNANGTSIQFDRIPVLAEHVTIPPHATVTDAKHRYSFTESGTDLCFHSPQAVPDAIMNLPAFLKSVSEGFLDRGEKIQLQAANEQLSALVAEVDPLQAAKFSASSDGATDDPIGNWMAWGNYLESEYGISQYALVNWKDSFLL